MEWAETVDYLVYKFKSCKGRYTMKQLIKRIVRYLIAWYVDPLYDQYRQMQEKENLADKEIKKLVEECQLFQRHMQELNTRLVEYSQIIKQQSESLSACTEKIIEHTSKLEYCNVKLEQNEHRLQDHSQFIQEYGESIDLLKKMLNGEKNLRTEAEESIVQQIHQAKTQIQKAQESIQQLDKCAQTHTEQMASVARDVIRTKWKLIDYLETQDKTQEKTLTCEICGYHGDINTYQLYESTCIFDGGVLKRYQCPKCGVIFGPAKFRNLTTEEFNDDYVVHYLGHKEADSTNAEIDVFRMLHPQKGKTYLNYGCGIWSRSMQILQDEGYIIYGYEPYAKDDKNPFLITSREQLCKMRFDGIFSHDLLEHLSNPVEELKFMESLLATPDSKMSHGTACYLYKYEYTRFHMFFFTGKSIQLIAQQAGLKIIEEVSDAATDFYCKVYQQLRNYIDYTPKLCTNEFGKKENSEIVLQPKGISYGPYITLPAGSYQVELCIEGLETTEKVPIRITINSGQRILEQNEVGNGIHKLSVTLEQAEKEWELVVENTLSHPITVKTVRFLPGGD